MKHRLWLGCLLLRGISIGNLPQILFSVTNSSSVIVTVVVGARVGVIVVLPVHLCQQHYNELIMIFDHLLLFIIAPMVHHPWNWSTDFLIQE
jgi:hypothetical protein